LDTSTSGWSIVPNKTSPSPLDQLVGAAKTALGIVGTATTVANYVTMFLKFVGILDNPDPNAAYTNLESAIQAVAGTVTYHDSEQERTHRLNFLASAVTQIADDATSSGMIHEDQGFWDANDVNFSTYVRDGGDMTAFERAYIESQTNGLPVYFPQDVLQAAPFTWKLAIGAYRSNPQGLLARPLPSSDAQNGFVYDWRLALPALLQLDANRLFLFIAEDKSHGLDPKVAAVHRQEVEGFRTTLEGHLQNLSMGLYCDTQPVCTAPGLNPITAVPSASPQTCPPTTHYSYEVACADIYSGINSTIAIDCNSINPCPDAAQAALVRAYNSVRRATPWFATQAMIDALFLFENGLPDLTTGDGLIHSKLNPSLCLDVGSGGGAQLSSCGNAQHWAFDRSNYLLVPISGGEGALDAVGPLPGTPAQLAVLNSNNSGLSQEWSYDPLNRILNNGLGNALNIPVANPQAGQSLDTDISADLTGIGGDLNGHHVHIDVQEQWNEQDHYMVAPHTGYKVFIPRCNGCSVLPTVILGAGADGALYTRSITAGTYSGPTAITEASFAPLDAAIAVGAQSATQTDAFLVANDGAVYMTSQTNAGPWPTPTAITAKSFATPGAPLDTATQNGQLWVALIDASGKLEIVAWSPTAGWQAPVAVTPANYAPTKGNVAFGRRSSGELDVFAIGSDGGLKYMAFNLGIWSGPYLLSLGNYAPPGSPIAAAVDAHGFLNVFSVANDGSVDTKWDCTPLWCGNTALTAKGFAPLGAGLSSLSFTAGSMNVFVVDQNGILNVLSNGGTSWTGPTAISATGASVPGGATAAVAETTSQLDVFAVSSDGLLLESINTGAGWSALIPFE
jgi:hypothetical protein